MMVAPSLPSIFGDLHSMIPWWICSALPNTLDLALVSWVLIVCHFHVWKYWLWNSNFLLTLKENRYTYVPKWILACWQPTWQLHLHSEKNWDELSIKLTLKNLTQSYTFKICLKKQKWWCCESRKWERELADSQCPKSIVSRLFYNPLIGETYEWDR